LQVGKRKERSVRVTFELSYERLDEWPQVLFRALGVFLPWFEVEAVAAVLGENEMRVRRGLRRLIQMGLVNSVEPGEYEMHGLIHRYAVELSLEDERLEEWRERFARYYLELAQQADATGGVERIGEYLEHISQGAFCALVLRNREMVMAYVRYAGSYLSFGDDAGLVDGENSTGPDGLLRAARLRLKLGRVEDALRLGSKVREGVEQGRAWIEATLIEGEASLAMGRAGDAAAKLDAEVLWEQLAQLDAGDELLFRAWALSERVRAAGETIACEEQAAEARARWEAGQTSSERAQLRLMRVAPLSEDSEEAVRALEERMELAEEAREWGTWLADALRRGFLLARKGDVAQAQAALGEVEEREAEMEDARFEPWVSLLRARVAWAAGRDKEGEQAYEAAVEELAAVFGRTVFWDVAREGETAEKVWRRALRIDDVFRHVELVSEMYPLFVGLDGDLPDEESALREEYVTLQEEMGWAGVELPDWDWLVGEDDDAVSPGDG